MDVHDPATRSKNMSRIRATNTKPELTVRKLLFSKGFRYRIHVKSLPGKPDIVLPKYKTVIFVHGCFWHSHENCRYAAIPQTNKDFWIEKLARTKERDKLHKEKLTSNGWKVIDIFECQLKPRHVNTSVNELIKNLNSGNND